MTEYLLLTNIQFTNVNPTIATAAADPAASSVSNSARMILRDPERTQMANIFSAINENDFVTDLPWLFFVDLSNFRPMT